MKHYKASTTIHANAQDIWKALLDGASYPTWDPGMVRVEGEIAKGKKVKFFTKFQPDQAFAVKVTAFEPNQKLVLTGGIPLGLFKSERTHTLTAQPDGTTHFQTEESFTGLLAPVLAAKIPDLTESFQAFADGLKRFVETKA